MPPKRVLKKPPPEYHIEVAVGELELRVDAVRSEIEATLDSSLSEMRRVIEAAVLRLPARGGPQSCVSTLCLDTLLW